MCAHLEKPGDLIMPAAAGQEDAKNRKVVVGQGARACRLLARSGCPSRGGERGILEKTRETRGPADPDRCLGDGRLARGRVAAQGLGRGRRGDGSRRPPRRRLLRLCQRRLDEDDRDSGRPRDLCLIHLRRRRGREARRGHHPERGQVGRRPGHPIVRGDGRGVLRRVHERGGDREARARSPEIGPRRDRGDQRQGRARARSRKELARRLRRAQLHRLLHGSSVRALGGAGLRRSEPLRGLSPPGRPRDAGSGQLPENGSQVRRAAGQVQGPRHRRPETRERSERGSPRRPRVRARAAHRRVAWQPHRLRRRAQGEQPLEDGRVRREGAGARLGGVLRGRGPLGPAGDHGLASERREGARGARRQ